MSEESKSVDLVELANWALAGIVVAVVAGYLYRYASPSSAARMIGKKAPSFSMATVDGDERVGPSDYRGQVVVMDFWATWCPPCHEQAGELREMMADEEVASRTKLLLVNTDEPSGGRRQKVRRYLSRRKLDYTTVLDDGTVMRKYGVDSFPTLVVVAPDGEISFAEPGVHSAGELKRLVARAADQ